MPYLCMLGRRHHDALSYQAKKHLLCARRTRLHSPHLLHVVVDAEQEDVLQHAAEVRQGRPLQRLRQLRSSRRRLAGRKLRHKSKRTAVKHCT